MSVQLLDKTRKINKLLHNTSSSKVVFNDICKVMVGTLKSNILVISKKGKVLGVGRSDGVPEIEELLSGTVGEFIDPLLNERFLRKRPVIISTNLSLEELQARYTDRIFSRLTGEFTFCRLSGPDIRIALKFADNP